MTTASGRQPLSLVAERLTWRPRVEAWAAFLISFVGLLAVTLLQAPKLFYYDAGVYWASGGLFVKNGHFSFLNYNNELRGYFLPLLDHLVSGVDAAFSLNDSTGAKVVNVVVFALIAAVLVPRLAELTWPEHRWGVGRRVLLAAVLATLWGGFLAFPLSDMPAVAAFLTALIAASNPRPLRMLAAGAACALAIDMRPSYILLPVSLALIVGITWWHEKRDTPRHRLRYVGAVACAVVGFGVITLPETWAMHHNFGYFGIIPGSHAGLTNLQYNDGLQLQLYDTYVGHGHQAPQMDYVDPSGSRLLAATGQITGTGQYAKVALNHPLIVLGVFYRHVVNGLDQRYNTPYVEHVGANLFLRILSLGFVFLALLRLGSSYARSHLAPTRWRYLLAGGVAGLTAIPSAMETRYMLPFAVLSYMIVLTPAWAVSLRGATETPRRARLAATGALALAAFLAAVVPTITATSAHLK